MNNAIHNVHLFANSHRLLTCDEKKSHLSTIHPTDVLITPTVAIRCCGNHLARDTCCRLFEIRRAERDLLARFIVETTPGNTGGIRITKADPNAEVSLKQPLNVKTVHLTRLALINIFMFMSLSFFTFAMVLKL